MGYTFQGAVLSHRLFPGSFFRVPGSHLLSHAVSSIVSSAASVLTNVFGMGTGVSPKRIATGKFRYLNSVSAACHSFDSATLHLSRVSRPMQPPIELPFGVQAPLLSVLRSPAQILIDN